jgi:hypothetical protein
VANDPTQPTRWVPIATAPRVRDQPILLWNGSANIGEWDGHSSWYVVANGGYAWDGDGETGGIPRVESPSHWMPLPDPPV